MALKKAKPVPTCYLSGYEKRFEKAETIRSQAWRG